jgi:hypothetical protein
MRPESSMRSRITKCSANGPAASRSAPPTLNCWPSCKIPPGIGRGDQRFNDAARHRLGLIAPHHQARHAEGAIDAAPLMARQIKRNEQIAGKKRGFDGAQFTRVPNGLMALRQESPEALILELYLRAAFAQRQRMHDIPALALGESGAIAPEGLFSAVFRGMRDRRHDLDLTQSTRPYAIKPCRGPNGKGRKQARRMS